MQTAAAAAATLDATHDGSHEDRLNLPLVIAPRTRTTVRVTLSAVEAAPDARPMDLSHIAAVMLFGQEGGAQGELYVSASGSSEVLGGALVA